ncbi:AbrB family transcriptional regulator [Salinibacillus xinjiangensis]|uniref:AbrB family transcriptional regulator n=1 Tax=Salinibacillus xinjiangensis TaxID=1229268 RepID=A0A6G1X4B9_9BACI|nr:AbrB family transcriptional regulator [Salinibacillus xinjiangensis]MRG85792.1 AbrB family transcriptional regulator [Salinibacillus xinjiangensis]
MKPEYKSFIYTMILALGGGLLFQALHIPLPWILGPITFLLIYKSLFHQKTSSPAKLRNISFILLGIQIGGTFTSNTFGNVAPYFFPFLALTSLMILIGLTVAYFISKKSNLDTTTSILGAVPGGLSAMIALSTSFHSNTVYVTIFHSIRLLAVLFIVPFVATHYLYSGTIQGASAYATEQDGHIATILLYVAFALLAKALSNKVPASFVIIPMLLTGVLNATGFTMYHLPNYFFIGAQMVLGSYLGHTISLKDIIKVGKYCVVFLILNIGLIFVSFLFGYVFSQFTSMDLATAVLSFAPGGLVEMGLTAQMVGGDPSIVSSLQAVRLLIIVILLPVLLKGLLPKLNRAQLPSIAKKTKNHYDKGEYL